MVRALIAGTKTQTRRLLRVPDRLDARRAWADPGLGAGGYLKAPHIYDDGDAIVERVYPFCEIGDRLWVRESCSYDRTDRDWRYAADGTSVCSERGFHLDTPTPDRWPRGAIPSIHMPRSASRLTLAVTDVRVQRLQDITEADAVAEGISHAVPPFGDWSLISPLAGLAWTPPDKPPPLMRFAYLWDSINGERAGAAWADNPWIVAVTFAVERRNVNDAAQRKREVA